MNAVLNTKLLASAPVKAPSQMGQGTHLLCEWYGCDFTTPYLNKARSLRLLCVNAATASGLSVVGDVFHQFEAQGVTGTVLLAESHLAIHTWPEEGFVTVDVYVCNYLQDNTQKALKLHSLLKASFKPTRETLLNAPRGLQHDQ